LTSKEKNIIKTFERLQKMSSNTDLTSDDGFVDGQEQSDEDLLIEWMNMVEVLKSMRHKLRCRMQQPRYCLPFLQPGRLVYVRGPSSLPRSCHSSTIFNNKLHNSSKTAASGADSGVAAGEHELMDFDEIVLEEKVDDFQWGVVINFQKRFAPDTFVVHVLVEVSTVMQIGKLSIPLPKSHAFKNISHGEMPNSYSSSARNSSIHSMYQIIAISLEMIHAISSVRIFVPNDIRSRADKEQLFQSIRESKRSFPDFRLPLLDPIIDLRLHLNPSANNDKDMNESAIDKHVLVFAMRIKELEAKISKSPIYTRMTSAQRKEVMARVQKDRSVALKVRALKEKNKHSHINVFRKDLESRVRVLRRLGHIDKHDMIMSKGRVAAEVESVDELLATELIFDGMFNSLEPAVACALLTCLFDFEKTSADRLSLPQDLQSAYNNFLQVARHVATVCNESDMHVNVEEYSSRFKSGLMFVTYLWCKGHTFPDVCSHTSMFEGSIIRIWRRLDELLRQLCEAAAAIGNNDLLKKFATASTLLKRGLPFSSSLYL
jgi:ATP-dependent RNA helicase DOB1